MKPIIEVQNLSKKYQINAQRQRYLSLRDSLTDLVQFGKNKEKEDFWALKDINFTVEAGESVGIIGRNGAGKSTLLKILSRITPPTKGRVILRGRIASLLEVGTGFHPELTGRENVYFNGSILGLRKTEIDKRFDEIVDFSGVEQFIDTPLKQYSSGMQLRLAFAVAAHLEPEILVIDEVLAVGDAEFQKKCLGKMGEVVQRGRTVLFVSHNMDAIVKLCTKSILLSQGETAFVGTLIEGVNKYTNTLKVSDRNYSAEPKKKPIISKININTSLANNIHEFGKPLEINFEIFTPFPIIGTCFSFQIVDYLGKPIVHLWTFDNDIPMCRKKGKHQVKCIIPNPRLYMGDYTINTYLSEPPGGELFESLKSVASFTVEMYNESRLFKWAEGACVYIENCTWEVKDSL